METGKYAPNMVYTPYKCFQAYKKDRESSCKYATSTKTNVIVNDDGNDKEGYDEMQKLDTFKDYVNRVQMQKLELDFLLGRTMSGSKCGIRCFGYLEVLFNEISRPLKHNS